MRGFTVIETLIAAVIFLILATFMLMIFTNHTGVFIKQNSLVDEGIEQNTAINRIIPLIKQASSVSSGYPELDPTYTTGTNILVLKLPSLSAGGVIENTYDFVIISADTTIPTILRLKVFPNAASTRPSENLVLSRILSNITFKYLDKNNNQVTPTAAAVVETTLTLSSGSGSSKSTRSSTILTNLRNN